MEVFTSIREIWVFSCYIDVMNSLFCKIILLIQVIFLFEFRYSSISLNHLMRWNDERWWEGNITMIKTITKKNAYVEQLCSICSFPRFMFSPCCFLEAHCATSYHISASRLSYIFSTLDSLKNCFYHVKESVLCSCLCQG